jgi:hypothetical protein
MLELDNQERVTRTCSVSQHRAYYQINEYICGGNYATEGDHQWVEIGGGQWV